MKELGTKTRDGVAIVPISAEYYYTEYEVKVQVSLEAKICPPRIEMMSWAWSSIS